MEVVGHEHVRMQLHLELARVLGQHRQKQLVIGVAREDRLAVVAALDDVVRVARDGQTGKTGHGSIGDVAEKRR